METPAGPEPQPTTGIRSATPATQPLGAGGRLVPAVRVRARPVRPGEQRGNGRAAPPAEARTASARPGNRRPGTLRAGNARPGNGRPGNGRSPALEAAPAGNGFALRARPPSIEKLWSAYRRRAGDSSRNRLVEAYQPLVREVVRRFAFRLPRSVDRGDLDTAANFGLISAIEGFDPSRGVRFESYCELRVKGALLDELRSQDWLPRPWRARLELQKRVCERLRGARDRDPTDEEVAGEMGMPLDEYRQIFGMGLPGVPLGSMPQEEGSDESTPGLDVLEDRHGPAPGEKLTRDEILRLVTQKLTVQEYRIVYLKYWEELSMREIGELMHLSESRVCKVHARLLERLKDRFRVHVPE